MSTKDALAARFGGNVRESMGAGGGGGFVLPSGAIPGESTKYQGCTRVKSALLIETDRVVPDPNQPRKEFEPEALDRLAGSLQERGQLQPIRVRWEASMERWIIIAGERRWRAAVQAGLATITAIEATGPLTEPEILEEQLVENCLREDLRPIEQARAYEALLTARGLSQRQLAERLHVSQASIAKALALLNLPGPIQASVDSGEIAPQTAYELSRVEDRAAQATLAHEAAVGRLKRDEVQERAKPKGPASGAKGRGGKAKKITSRVLRTATGPRVTVEFKKGLDDALIAATLREVLGQVEARLASGEQTAA